MATSTIRQPPRIVRGPVPAARAKSGLTGFALIMPAVILFYAALMPSEVRFEISGQVFYPPRIAAIALFPAIIWRLVGRQLEFTIWDGLVFLSAFWMILSFMVIYGPEVGVLRGGALGFDVAVPYLIGRLCFREANDLRRFLIYASPGLLLAGSSMLLEVVFAQPIVRPAAAAIFGQLPFYENGVAVGSRGVMIEERLGMLRASGPFSHPILAGVFLASFLPLFFLSGIRGWPKKSGTLAAVFAIFSVSSTAFLALLMGVVMVVMDWVQRAINFVQWKMMIIVIGGAMLAIEIVSKNGIIPIITRYTLNGGSAQYRRFIWEFGTQSVAAHPWFGIGFNDYERPDWMLSPSVDNHWLLVAMRFGAFPAFALFGVMIAGVVLLSVSSTKRNEIDRRMYVGLAIALFTVGILGFSVALFSGLQSWFYLLMAIAISLGTSQVGMAPRRPAPGRKPMPRTPLPRQSGPAVRARLETK
ncbi:MAG: O-antigen ligase family protein [Erythrobacter sp.]